MNAQNKEYISYNDLNTCEKIMLESKKKKYFSLEYIYLKKMMILKITIHFSIWCN